MSEIFVLVAIAVLVPALSNWRLALVMALIMGFAQDILRKLTAGEPVYMVFLFAPVFALAALGLLMRGGTLSLAPMFELHPAVRGPVLLFLAVIAAQVLLTFANTGSLILAALGAVIYVLPFIALVVAMYFASDIAAVANLFKVYIFASLLFSLGVYLNVLGYQDGVLDSVGAGIFIYPEQGGVLKLPSGFFRAAETAAWHGATAAILTCLLVMLRMFPGGTLGGVIVIGVLVVSVILTGRRKMLIELLMFATLFSALLALYGGRSVRLVVMLSVVGSAVYLGQLIYVQDQPESTVLPYLSRYSTVTQEASGRVEAMIFGSFRAVIDRVGWFGVGAGTATQGAAQFGGGSALVGWGAEGGTGKVLAELGIHGFIAGLWLLIAFGRACHVSIRDLQGGAQWRWSLLCIGLSALLLTNLMVFSTAAQVFGDPFVLLMLGLSLGFILRARGHAEDGESALEDVEPHPQPGRSSGHAG